MLPQRSYTTGFNLTLPTITFSMEQLCQRQTISGMCNFQPIQPTRNYLKVMVRENLTWGDAMGSLLWLFRAIQVF